MGFCRIYACTGELDFGQVMSMFRDELLDLNAILDYIKLPPAEDSPTSSTVRPDLARCRAS